MHRLPAALYHRQGVEVARFNIILCDAFIGSQLLKKLSYTLPRWSLAYIPWVQTFPRSGEAVTLPASLDSALVHGVASLTTLGLFGCIRIITILGLVPFTSLPSPNKRGGGEQEPRAQGGASESLHVCAASQNAVPPPSLLLIVSLLMASPGDSAEQGEGLLS